MLRWRTLWAATALCTVPLLWQAYQSACLGQSACSGSLGDASGPSFMVDAKPCNCSSCRVELTTAVWFKERYDSAICPLLTVHSAEMDPDVLRWWLAMSQLIWELLRDRAELWGYTHVKTASLRWQPQMNRAPTVGFEADVGMRTTHHFMYPESAVDLQPGTHLVLVPFKVLDLQWLISAFSTGQLRYTYRRVKEHIEADRSKVLIVSPAFLKYIHDKWTQHHGKYPSTGFIALLFALHSCDQLAAYGYGSDSTGTWHHYWEQNRNAGAFRKTGVHNATFEFALIKKLADEGKISFHD